MKQQHIRVFSLFFSLPVAYVVMQLSASIRLDEIYAMQLLNLPFAIPVVIAVPSWFFFLCRLFSNQKAAKDWNFDAFAILAGVCGAAAIGWFMRDSVVSMYPTEWGLQVSMVTWVVIAPVVIALTWNIKRM